jgi:hypothetical protein
MVISTANVPPQEIDVCAFRTDSFIEKKRAGTEHPIAGSLPAREFSSFRPAMRDGRNQNSLR